MPFRLFLLIVGLTVFGLFSLQAAVPESLPRVTNGQQALHFVQDKNSQKFFLKVEAKPRNLEFFFEEFALDSIIYQLLDFDSVPQGTCYPWIRYTNLPPGKYQFKAKGWLRGAIVFQSNFQLAVAPNAFAGGIYWAVGFFLLAIAVAVVSLFFFSNRHNFKRIQEFQVRIARDLHDQVGSSLVSIRYTNKALMNRTSHPEAVQMLKDIDLLCAESLESLREAVWAVDPQHRSLEAQWSRMIDFASRLLHDADMDLVVEDQLPNARQLIHRVLDHPEQRRNAYLMFREIITNIVKHSQAKEVKISLKPHAEGLELRISDDGIGFDSTTISPGHNGVENIYERGIDNLIHVDLRTAPGAGTTWCLIIPQL